MVPLYGREVELRIVSGMIDGVCRGHGASLSVVGEPGIGKSSLLDAGEAIARNRGVDVRRISADEILADHPLGVLAALLGVDTSPHQEDQRVTPARTVPPIAGGTASPPQAVVDRIVASLDTSPPRPEVLIIDDAQWCDRWTLVVLRRLLRVASSIGKLFIVAARPSSLADFGHDARSALLFDEHIDLGPLDTSAVTQMAEHLAGARLGPRFRSMLGRAGGHPLYIAEIVRHAGPRTVTTEVGVDIADESIPSSLVRTVRDRCRSLGQESAEVLSLCALLGDRFPFSDAVAATGRGEEQLHADLRALDQAGFLSVDGEDVSFRHSLYREVEYETIPPSVRRSAHLRIAEAIGEGNPVAALRHRALAASEHDEPMARAIADFSELHGIRHPEASADLAGLARDLTTNGDLRERLTELRAEALVHIGRVDEAALLLEQTLAEGAAHLYCEFLLATAHFLQARHVEASQRLESLLDRRLDAEFRSRVAAGLAMARLATGSPDVEEAARDAIAVSDADAEAAAWGRVCLGRALAYRHDYNGALRETATAVEVAESSQDLLGHRCAPWFFHGITLLDLDRHSEVADAVVAGRRISDRVGTEYAVPLFDALSASLAYRQGRTDTAYVDAMAGVDVAEDLGALQGVVWCLALAALAELDRGELTAAAKLLDRSDQHSASGQALLGIDFQFIARSRLLEEQGCADDARRMLKDAWGLFEALGIHNCLPLMATARTRAELRAGEPSEAAEVVETIEQAAAASSAPGIVLIGRWCRALVDHDVGCLEELGIECKRLHRISDVVDLELDLIRLLVVSDPTTATASLDSLEEGFPRFHGRWTHLREVVGTSSKECRTSGQIDLGRLTRSEALVVELVAAGHTNGEVAAERGVSIRTVETQLYRVFQKLGVTNRAQLVRAALLAEG